MDILKAEIAKKRKLLEEKNLLVSIWLMRLGQFITLNQLLILFSLHCFFFFHKRQSRSHTMRLQAMRSSV